MGKLYITFTTKPITVAAAENLPAVEAVLDTENQNSLEELIKEVTEKLYAAD